MAYVKQTWNNGAAGSTPISAARLAHMEDGIENPVDSIPDGTYAGVETPGVAMVAAKATTTIGGGVARVNEGPLSLKDSRVGAVMDGVADDTAAWAAAEALLPSTGGTVFMPPGTIKKTGPWVFTKDGITLRGASRDATKFLDTSGDVFTFSGTRSHMTFESFRVDAGAGNIFALGAQGLLLSSMRNLRLVQGAVNKSLFYQYSTSLFEPLFIDVLVEHCELTIATGATVPGWYIRSGSAANSNTFRRLRLNGNNNIAPFFHLETTAGGGNYDLVMEDITGEVCTGGILKALGLLGLTLSNVRDSDAGTYTNHLFEIEAGAGVTPGQVTMKNCGRRGGTLGTGIKDIKISTSATNVVLVNCDPSTGIAALTVPADAMSIGMAQASGARMKLGKVDASAFTADPVAVITQEYASGRGLRMVCAADRPMLETKVAAAPEPSFYATTLGTLNWSDGASAPDTNLYRSAADTLKTDDRFVAVGGIDTRVVATASLPAAGASMNGHVLIEDAGAGDRNLIIYAGGQRFRIDGGAGF